MKSAKRKPLRLTVHAAAGRAHVPYLRRHLRKAHAILNPPLRELSLAMVGDRQMAALHMQFMNIAGPTDVLTFPLDVDAGGLATTGEVVVCAPEARRRAKEHGVAVREELLLYALHGMLHLAGFDDRTDRDFKRMHRTEDQILARLGVGAVYHRLPPGCSNPPAASAAAIKLATGSSRGRAKSNPVTNSRPAKARIRRGDC